MDIITILEDFIVNELAKNKSRISPDESLIRSGVLDSLTLLQLIAFIEERFGITVINAEMDPENFQTINSTKRFIEQKIKAKA